MENNIGVEEILKAVDDNIELKSIISRMYEIAQKRIEEGKAGIYSDNYKVLDDRYQKALSVDGSPEGKYFLKIGQDCIDYQKSAAIQYLNNIMEVSNSGKSFSSFDGKISFDGLRGFSGRDIEIERLFDNLIEKYVEIHPESKNEIMGNSTSDSASDPVQTSEETEEIPVNDEDSINNNVEEISTDVSEDDIDLNGPASIVQYRLLIKKEMKKVENQLHQAISQLPNDKEVNLSDLKFKRVLKLKKRFEGLENEYNKTLDSQFKDKYLERAGILNRPIAGLQKSINSFDEKLKELEDLKPTLSALSSKGITSIKISLVKKICKILNNLNVTATSIQRGLIVPKSILDVVMNKYVTHYEAKDEYYNSIISDVSLKLDTLDEEKFLDRLATSFNEKKLKKYKKKKEILDDFLSKTDIIPIITITGSRIRACKKDVVRQKRNSVPEEDISIDNQLK